MAKKSPKTSPSKTGKKDTKHYKKTPDKKNDSKPEIKTRGGGPKDKQ